MKRKRDSLPFTREQVYAEYEAALMRLALLELQEKELEEQDGEVDAKACQEDTQPLDMLLKAAEPKAIETIRRYTQRQHTKMFVRQTLPRLGMALASIALVVVIGFATAFAVVAPFRTKVLEFLFQIDQEYTRIGVGKDPTELVDAPADWQGTYFPAYIPDGYEMFESMHFEQMHKVEYRDSDENKLLFYEYADELGVNIDTEEANIREVLINENPALVSVKGEKVNISWSESNVFFRILYVGATIEAIRIAESVRPVR